MTNKYIIINKSSQPDSESIWPTLPKLSDFVDIETLCDSEEIEDAFYQVSKLLGW